MGTETSLYLNYTKVWLIKIIKTPHGDGNYPHLEIIFLYLLIKIIKTPHGDGNSDLTADSNSFSD